MKLEGRGSLRNAADRLRIALEWVHLVTVNQEFLERDGDQRPEQRLKRARAAYFGRMARTPECFYVLMDC